MFMIILLLEISLFSSRDKDTQNAAKWPHQQNGALRAPFLLAILSILRLFWSRDENNETSSILKMDHSCGIFCTTNDTTLRSGSYLERGSSKQSPTAIPRTMLGLTDKINWGILIIWGNLLKNKVIFYNDSFLNAARFARGRGFCDFF